MKTDPRLSESGVNRYRLRLMLAMMLVIVALTFVGVFLAERKVAIETRLDLLHDFRSELATLHEVQEVRQAALAERCRELVARPRIHAALEDNALDLLYPSARDELREILETGADKSPATLRQTVSARFYRFLNGKGAVITPPDPATVGVLPPAEERQLALPSLNTHSQSGYLLCGSGAHATAVHEILALPITSTETGEVIAALVVGFEPAALIGRHHGGEIKNGIWSQGRLQLAGLAFPQQETLDAQLRNHLGQGLEGEKSFEARIADASYLVFSKELNAGSLYTPAYEVALYPLTPLVQRQRKIRSHVLLAGSALLLLGLGASHLMARRLSAPVEELAVTSEKHRAQGVAAEKALRSTSAELQRSARFSADASHQLKTPVTVLRAGVEELLTREDFPPDVYQELSALLHQTYRITGVVDDLLLLSRMDAGRLEVQFEPVDLSRLLEEWIDDMSALPDNLRLKLETNFPPHLYVIGEKRYVAIVIQNLLENAYKYNIPDGRICVAAEARDESVVLTVENTGIPIPPSAQEHIFERFHRGTTGENVPGHGLGLNLARELARILGGDVTLVRSDSEGIEFEALFRKASSAQQDLVNRKTKLPV